MGNYLYHALNQSIMKVKVSSACDRKNTGVWMEWVVRGRWSAWRGWVKDRGDSIMGHRKSVGSRERGVGVRRGENEAGEWDGRLW